MEVRSYTSVTEDKGYPGVSGNAPPLHSVIVASWGLVLPFVAGVLKRLRRRRKTFCLFLKRVAPQATARLVSSH